MQMLPELANTILVAFVGVLVVYVTRVQVQLKRVIRDLRSDMNDGFGRLDGRLSAEIASVRSDLVQVALAVGARARPQSG